MSARSRQTALAFAVWLTASLPPSTAAAQPEGLPLRAVRYELDLGVDFGEEKVSGTVRITLRNTTASPVPQASLLLYRLLTVRAVRGASQKPLPFTQRVAAFTDEPRRQVNHLVVAFAPPLAPGAETTVEVEYDGYLAGYVETGTLYVQDRIDEAFTILREDAEAYPTVRVPSASINRAAGLPEFDYLARITVPKTHVVANGGTLVQRIERGERATYVYRSIKPSWRMDFAVARFGVLERDGFRVFHLPGDARSADRVLSAARDATAAFTKWFGPIQGPPAFTIIEVPDGWGSQADVTSILQSAAAFKDPDHLGELYHEVSHLWNVRSTDRSPCRWEEGLAMFLQYLALERLDGKTAVAPAAIRATERLLERAKAEPRLRTVPMVRYGEAEMTGFSYSVGMLMFQVLHRVAGPDQFDRLVGGFFRDHGKEGATTEEFVSYARSVVGVRVAPLFRDWLFTTRWLELLESGLTVQEIAGRYLP